MPTAIVRLESDRTHTLSRALLDSGSQHTLITAECASRLRLRICPEPIHLRTLSNTDPVHVRGYAYVTLCHRGDPPRLKVKVYIINNLVDPLPVRAFRCNWPKLTQLTLADHLFYRPRPIDVLLGSDVLPFLIRPETVLPTSELPGAIRTTLGWVLFGPYARHRKSIRHVTFMSDTASGDSTQHNHSRANAHNNDSPSLTPSGRSSTSCCLASSEEPPISQTSSLTPVTSYSVPTEYVCESAEGASFSNTTSPLSRPACAQLADENLTELVRKFWELDRVTDALPFTPAERQCEEIYRSSVSRTSTGRYIVELPFASRRLGVSINVAKRQFARLERRLDQHPALRDAYHEFMRDYLHSGHMERIIESASPSSYEPYYIPHHPVHRPDDPPTKIRVVFNASCASANGKSLNDLLLTGPKLQADISILLLRFRLHRFVFTADIRQMYRQILVSPKHRDYQRIIWRFSDQEPIQSYRLNTVTYGVSSAPYLALRTLQQLAFDEGVKYPDAKSVLLEEVYVDDILTGCSSESDATHLRQELQDLLMAGGFELRKWATNHPPLLHGIPSDHCRELVSSDPLLFDRDPSLKILGLGWNPLADHFFYSVRLTTAPLSKRTVLSQMARIFDPLGWLTPVTFSAKVFFRRLCQLPLEWDQDLPSELMAIWQEFRSQLPSLAEVQIPRFIPETSCSSTHHLVGFCDASESGYAAVVYLHTADPSGHLHVNLLAAKSKIAPCKAVTLPRLELCAAHLLSKLMHHLATRVLPQLTHEYIAFSDSSVALAWIRGESHKWKTFVGNRVAEIQTKVSPSRWKHVKSEDNPADCASRGVQPRQIRHHPLWWHGPRWLSSPLSSWPVSSVDLPPPENVNSEAKPVSAIVFAAVASEPSVIERFSSLLRLKRVIAFCRRFVFNARRPPQPRIDCLSSVELHEAECCVVRLIQLQHFAEEIIELQKPFSRHRLIMQLRLFIDEHQIIRVGGRLPLSALPYQHKHPVLLPRGNHFTNLIIDDAHLRLLHAGALATHSFIRRRFWILDGRNVVRHRLRKCNRCFTCKPRPIIQPMGNLPSERLSSAAAFTTTGVDYAGPFYVTSARLRGAVSTKAYLVVFICFATKAVHLELASELSTPAFIAAFRRFIARRGNPSVIFSDNGTNFVGASNYLRDLGRLLSTPKHQQSLCDVATSSGTDWRFIPPASPHFGGIWEAAVKSAKHHLVRVIGEQRLTYEEFLTVITQVEAILNSRPLYLPSSDPSDLEALTPGHFLIFRPLTSPPDRDVTAISPNRLARWQLIQRLQQDFWKRWRVEYLHTLQQRHKWLQPSTPILPGTIVIIHDDNLPPLKWPLGRISSVFPGDDSITRVAEVTTASGTIRRPIVKLCPIPTQ